MKQIKKYLRLGLLLSAAFGSYIKAEDCCQVVSSGICNIKTGYYGADFVGQDQKTQMHRSLNGSYDNNWSFGVDVTYRYQASRNGCQLAKLLFGESTLRFQGSNFGLPSSATGLNPAVASASEGSRTAGALIADYFGMGSATDASIKLNPSIVNNIIDVKLDLRSNCWWEGMWFQMNLPIVNSKWELKGCNQKGNYDTSALQAEGAYTIPAFTSTLAQLQAGLAAQDMVSPGLLTDATSTATPTATQIIGYAGAQLLTATSGGQAETLNGTPFNLSVGDVLSQTAVAAAPTLQAALAGYTFGDLEVRKYAKIRLNNSDDCCDGSSSSSTTNCSNSQWKLDGVLMQLGYDWLRCDDYHFGVYLKAVAPTGTSIDAEYQKFAFQPIIGNAKRFEFGGGITAHWEAWCNDCNDSSLRFDVDGYVTHVFKKNQFRIWDLDGKPMSRYALLKTFTKNDGQGNPFTAQGYNYTGLVAVADVNNACVGVSAAVHGEFVLDMIYSRSDWTAGLGYNFKGQSKETVSCNNDNDCCVTPAAAAAAAETYYGLNGVTPTTLLYAIGDWGQNADIQSLAVATSGITDASATAYSYNPATLYTTDAVTTDVFETFPQITNRSGLMESQALNILFGHVDYTWSDCCWMPTLGLIGSVGFTGSSSVTANYWDAGARFGFSY